MPSLLLFNKTLRFVGVRIPSLLVFNKALRFVGVRIPSLLVFNKALRSVSNPSEIIGVIGQPFVHSDFGSS